MRDGVLRINVLMDTFLRISAMAKSTWLCIKGFLWCFDVGRMLIYHGDNEASTRNERILVTNHHPCQIFTWDDSTRDAIHVCINSLSLISREDDLLNTAVSRITNTHSSYYEFNNVLHRGTSKRAVASSKICLCLSVQAHNLFIARNIPLCFMEFRISHHATPLLQ